MKNNSFHLREAILTERTDDGRLRCLTCMRKCIIPEGEVGFCKTRKNIGGKLYTLIFGDISSLSANPIEKKPFFHFYPGSKALTVGSWSCNFTCPWCQNWEISKHPPDEFKNYVSPEQFMRLLKAYKCQGTSISFNEPTLLLEYSLDVFRLAKKMGYYNTYVTNGYMTPQALELLIQSGLDAMNVDVKGCKETVQKYCGADVEHVWLNIHESKRRGIHIEITTLVIPRVNDDVDCLRSIAQRIKEEDENIPWHVTRFHPEYKMTDREATPIQTLERAREVGLSEGLKYVYIGNVPGHRGENTWCPNCGELLIERYIFSITKYRITSENKCPRCGTQIPIIGKPNL
ncbi:MAG: AmmeMemoRadiSam system radical SAM enzyme [Candidatus Freyarchaeota archaeon]|nr:AmmeMemoRadiSam system radical SAM enzyme [Candidatus Jordarchaeia archaeon]MBS7269619.1 AmmeMemoRadiSam system radical SAM enzyme [Candidatus Jordarchaeia archaeon]MBS7281194.1 AmmeMemoRadiSam system radical SAM enzyme [Candidatus Jordarchaeia archaeon]